MKLEDKKFAFLIWFEIFLIMIFANTEVAKPLTRYMIIVFFLTVVHGYSRKNFTDYFKSEHRYLKIALGIGVLVTFIALLIILL